MHGGEGAAERSGVLGEDDGVHAWAAGARRAGEMRRRARAAGAAGLTLCVALGCLALADYGDGARGRPGSLESVGQGWLASLLARQ